MLLPLLLGAILLTHGVEEPSSYQALLESLDRQIEALEQIADSYQVKANEKQEAAQPLLRTDWSGFAEAMKESEDMARQAIQTRRQAKKLRDQRDEVVRKHLEAHERHHSS